MSHPRVSGFAEKGEVRSLGELLLKSGKLLGNFWKTSGELLGNFWGSPGNFWGSLGNFWGTSGLLQGAGNFLECLAARPQYQQHGN